MEGMPDELHIRSRGSQTLGLSERNVRNYCAAQRVKGAILKGKIWGIPEKAMKPERVNKRVNTSVELLPRLRVEKKARLHGVIYHRLQIDMAYNSNHKIGRAHV